MATRTLPRFYYVANFLLKRLLLPLARVHVTVTGQEHVPRAGPLIVVGNHLSILDPPLIGTFFLRDLTFMSKIENFEGNPLRSWVVRNYGAFPVRRGEGDIGAIRRALKVLKEDGALFLAPEGTRSKDKQLGEPHEGVALIAQRSGAPIVPVGISGVEQFGQRVRQWQPTHVQISFGHPFRLMSQTQKPDREMLTAMSEAVMERIAAQLPAHYRGRFNDFTENQHYIAECGNITKKYLDG